MDLDRYPLPHPQVAARVYDGSAVIVQAGSGEVHVLNEVGTRIWELADGTRTGEAIARGIEAEYDVPMPEARADVEAFLESMLAAGTLELREQPTVRG